MRIAGNDVIKTIKKENFHTIKILMRRQADGRTDRRIDMTSP